MNKKNIRTTLIAAAIATILIIANATPDYMMISRADLMRLPTSGPAWNTIKASADANVTPNLCDQDNKSDVNALAAGIVYARTGDESYKIKAVSLINKAMASQKNGCYNAVLAMGRQLGGYVLAADFAGYREPEFTSWLETIVNQNIGGQSRWYILRFTAYDSASNWGVHALTSITAVDIFLNRTDDIEKDWAVFSGYGKPYGWPFNKASSYNEQWSCLPTITKGKLPIAINPSTILVDGTPEPCAKNGVNLDGAPVEDSSRSAFGSYSTYIHESLQGYAVMAQLWSRTGRNGWGENNGQVCRAAQFAERGGKLSDSSVSYFVSHMVNRFCGLNLPTKTPTNGGRMFGFSDWLYSGAVSTPVTNTPTRTVTSTPVFTNTPIIPTITVTATKTQVPQTPTSTATATATPSKCDPKYLPSVCIYLLP